MDIVPSVTLLMGKPSRLASSQTYTTLKVLLWRNWLEMVWITADGVATQVVEVVPLRDRTDKLLPHGAMHRV